MTENQRFGNLIGSLPEVDRDVAAVGRCKILPDELPGFRQRRQRLIRGARVAIVAAGCDMDVRARLGGGIFNHRGWLAGLGVKIVVCYRNQHATAKERKEKTLQLARAPQHGKKGLPRGLHAKQRRSLTLSFSLARI